MTKTLDVADQSCISPKSEELTLLTQERAIKCHPGLCYAQGVNYTLFKH